MANVSYMPGAAWMPRVPACDSRLMYPRKRMHSTMMHCRRRRGVSGKKECRQQQQSGQDAIQSSSHQYFKPFDAGFHAVIYPRKTTVTAPALSKSTCNSGNGPRSRMRNVHRNLRNSGNAIRSFPENCKDRNRQGVQRREFCLSSALILTTGLP